MHGTPHQARLVIGLHRGGSYYANRSHTRQRQGAHPVRSYQGRLTDAVQPCACAAEFQVPRADTREKWSVVTVSETIGYPVKINIHNRNRI